MSESVETTERKPFVRCANLDELALNNMKIDVVRDRARDKGKLDLDIKIDTELCKGEETFFEAHAGCKLTGVNPDDKKIFELNIEYFLSYKCREVHDWPAEELEYFANRNVILHVWPYLRETIDQMTRRASLNRVILPMLPPGVVEANHKHDDSAPHDAEKVL